MRRLALLLLVLLLLATPAGAKDAWDETEARLKAAGVDTKMRLRIHAAIRRAVKRLRKHQKPSGLIGRDVGTTALGGLALRHAAIPDARAGAKLALTLLLRHGRKEVRNKTYEAGIGALLLQAEEAEGADLKFLHHIHERLAKGPQRSDGYWTYGSAGGSGIPNLSTAQFACLGLWAAERTGAETAQRAWSDHLDALLKAQQDDGSWGYASPTTYLRGQYGRVSTYPTGTFMGLANLVLAHNALREEIAAEPERHARVLIARAAGRAALRRHAQWVLGAPGILSFEGGGWSHYTLYALEKACIFLDLEEVGGVRWYVEGANWLLGGQDDDGSWRTVGGRRQSGIGTIDDVGDPWRTSFALLFLLRASASYRPITPRPIDGPKTTTPRGDDTPPPPTDKRAAPSLKMPQIMLDRLQQALRRTKLTRIGHLLDAMRFVARTHRQIQAAGDAAGPLHAAWMQRAEALLLECATHFVRRGAEDRLLWQAVGVHALDALAQTHARVAPALMRSVLEMKTGKGFRSDYQFAWYGAAIDALRRLAPPGFTAWLRDRAVSGDTGFVWRTSAALTALGGHATAARGRERQSVLRTVIATMQPILRRSRGNQRIDGLLRDLQIVVQRLAQPSKPDDFPVLGGHDLDGNMKSVIHWWRRHRAPDHPLWER